MMALLFLLEIPFYSKRKEVNAMLKVENTEAKEEQIMDIVRDIARSYHKWEENRNGKRVVCIEYIRMFDQKRDGMPVDGSVV